MTYVQVIVPNWNGKHMLSQCLKALMMQTFSDFETILVDNGSTDGSVDLVKEHFPSVQVIVNDKNKGFAAAINQGIRASNSDYIATLNNDTEAESDWLEKLVQAAEDAPQVGMCASKMLFADRPHIINSTGINLDWGGIAWDRGGGETDTKEKESVEVFGPCAGAALYRRKMLKEIGEFDEDFFAYLEDVDIAWRAQLAGWHALYVPTARVYHNHSSTLGEGSSLKRFLLGRNKIWLIIKNYPMPWLLYHLPVIISYDIAAILYTLIKRQDLHSLKGRWAAFIQLPRMLSKRRRIQMMFKTNKWQQNIHPHELPWQVSKRYRHLSNKLN
jgi:hypothetical protein